jgi:hypothetical protein
VNIRVTIKRGLFACTEIADVPSATQRLKGNTASLRDESQRGVITWLHINMFFFGGGNSLIHGSEVPIQCWGFLK